MLKYDDKFFLINNKGKQMVSLLLKFRLSFWLGVFLKIELKNHPNFNPLPKEELVRWYSLRSDQILF